MLGDKAKTNRSHVIRVGVNRGRLRVNRGRVRVNWGELLGVRVMFVRYPYQILYYWLLHR